MAKCATDWKTPTWLSSTDHLLIPRLFLSFISWRHWIIELFSENYALYPPERLAHISMMMCYKITGDPETFSPKLCQVKAEISTQLFNVQTDDLQCFFLFFFKNCNSELSSYCFFRVTYSLLMGKMLTQDKVSLICTFSLETVLICLLMTLYCTHLKS